MTVTGPVAAGRAVDRNPQVRETLAGMAVARSLLPSGPPASGWRRSASFAKPDAISCKSFDPNQSALVETGLAATVFTHATNGEIVDAVRVFETDGQAGRAWTLTEAALRSCEGQTLERAGERLQQLVPISLQLGKRGTAFRIVASVDRGHVPVYNDLVLVRNRAAVVLIVFISADRPYPRASEQQLAQRAEDHSRSTGAHPLPA